MAFSAIVCLSVLLSARSIHAAPITDIVFMIDATSSMGGEIAGVRNGFSSFVSGLNSANVDAQFAIVVFGGQSELILDFTNDTNLVQNRLNAIRIGSNPGIHNNHNLNPEAGLETIRMVLGAANQSILANNNIAEDGILNFRPNARTNLILATDEDSDLPFNVANRQPGQSGNPPGTLSNPWQDEVDATAQAIIDNQAFVNMLVNRNDSPTISQYGDPLDDVSDADLLNFDPNATLANLLADPSTASSLQAQVLGAGLIGRTFNVAGANNPDFVDNFFAAKVQEIVNDPPGPQPIPEPSTFALLSLGIGATLIGYRRRRK